MNSGWTNVRKELEQADVDTNGHHVSADSSEVGGRGNVDKYQQRLRETNDTTARNSFLNIILPYLDDEPSDDELSSQREGDGKKDLKLLSQGKSVKGALRDEDVDIEALSNLEGLRYRIRNLVDSLFFESLVGFVIFINSVMMGLQTRAELMGESVDIFLQLENFFLAIYTIELVARLFGHGWSRLHIGPKRKPYCRIWYPNALSSGWVVFDAFLVLTGLVEALSTTAQQIEALSAVLPGNPTFFRLLRLLRLLRAIRLIVAFQTLYLLVRGILASVTT